MGIILIVVILSVVCYLWYCAYKQTEENDERNGQINSAETQYNIAVQETLKTKKEMLKSIAEIFGENDANRINEEKIWVGMPSQLLEASWGKARNTTTNYSNGKSIHKWFYGSFINRLGNEKYKFEVTLTDNLITGWKDLI